MSTPNPFILIIEDDAESAEALSLILRDWGAEVAHAREANGVQDIVDRRARDIRYVITDYHIGPGENGVTLAAQIAAAAPQAKILVLSGSFRGQAAVAAEAAGYDMMQKPARADAIVGWLNRS